MIKDIYRENRIEFSKLLEQFSIIQMHLGDLEKAKNGFIRSGK